MIRGLFVKYKTTANLLFYFGNEFNKDWYLKLSFVAEKCPINSINHRG